VGAQNLNLAAAFIAGILSFFSPCVLPLVPVYLGYMAGTAVSGLADSSRLRILAHALFFVLGFGLIFVFTGAAMGALGSLIYPLMPILVKVGGVILVILGLHMAGLITLPFLYAEKRFELGQHYRRNYWTSFLIGLVFAAGWTPCVGPILAAILLLAADSQTALTGALLLAVYALGLGIPFLAVAALVHIAVPALRKASRYLRLFSIAGGVLLMALGFLLLTDLWSGLVAWLNYLLPR